jgi:hypothetical protein
MARGLFETDNRWLPDQGQYLLEKCPKMSGFVRFLTNFRRETWGTVNSKDVVVLVFC